MFPILFVLMQDGALVMNQGLVSAKEWKLEKIRNPFIDGMNYHQTAISLAKNDSLLCIPFYIYLL